MQNDWKGKKTKYDNVIYKRNEKIGNYVPHRASLFLEEHSWGKTIFRGQSSSTNKNSSLSLDEKFCPIKLKVSLVEVQVNSRVTRH